MAVRDGAEIVYVARLSPRQIVNINIYVGSRLPVHCTSIGKTLLMDMSADQLRGLLGDGPYEALTENTITDAGRLAKELDSVRARGYAVGDEEGCNQHDGGCNACLSGRAARTLFTNGRSHG